METHCEQVQLQRVLRAVLRLLLRPHRCFLFDKFKNQLKLPERPTRQAVNEREQDRKTGRQIRGKAAGSYPQKTTQGKNARKLLEKSLSNGLRGA